MSRLYKSTLFSKSESGSNLLLSISIWDNASFIDSASTFVNLISVALIFSFNLSNFVVPGIGTIKSFCTNTQAKEIYATVTFFSFAILLTKSTTTWFFLSASSLNLGAFNFTWKLFLS